MVAPNQFQAHQTELVKPSSGHWQIYKEGRYLDLKKAILLSLDIEPDWFEGIGEREKFIFNGLHAPEYSHRLKVATQYVIRADWAIKPINELAESQAVDLALFAAWAISNQWQVPEPFKALAEPVSAKPAPQSKADIWKAEAVKIANRLWSEQSNFIYTETQFCTHIARELNQNGFRNQRNGELTHDTVRSEAIGAALWWATKGK